MSSYRPRTVRPLAVTLLALGAVLAAGLPAQAYGPPPSVGTAACTPAAQSANAGSAPQELTCTFTYTDGERDSSGQGKPSVGQPFRVTSTGVSPVGTPPAVTDANGQAVVKFAYLTCGAAGGTQHADVNGYAQTTLAQGAAEATCQPGLTPNSATANPSPGADTPPDDQATTANPSPSTKALPENQAGATERVAPNCVFSRTLPTGINGREDVCTFHTSGHNVNGISYALAHGLGNSSAILVRWDSAPDLKGYFTATVDYYGGDDYTMTAGLRNLNGTLGLTATEQGSTSGNVETVRRAADARAANVRSLVRYSVLSATAVTDDGTSTFSGDVGVDTAAAMTTVTRANIATGYEARIANDKTRQAHLDGQRAYDAIAALPAVGAFSGDLNGRTFTPGVYYTGDAFTLSGTLILDGQGDPNAVFIFKVDAALNTAAGSHLKLINGASASNVTYWVNGAAGTGADSSFEGSILSFGAITIGNGTAFHGNVYSMAAITLCNNKMRAPFA